MFQENINHEENEQYPNVVILISNDNKLVSKTKGIKKKITINFKLQHFTDTNIDKFYKSDNIENISILIIDSNDIINYSNEFISKFSSLNFIFLTDQDNVQKVYDNYGKFDLDLIIKDSQYNFVKILEKKIKKCINYFILEKKYSLYKDYLDEFVFSPDSDLRIEMAERTLALEALHESEKRFQDIIKNSRDIAYRLNFYTGKYDYISSSFEKLTGYPVKDVLENGFLNMVKLFHPEDQKKFKSYYNNIDKRIFSENNLQEIEYRFLCKNGDYKWFSDSRIVIENEDGTGAIIGNIRDITERKKVSEDLKETEEIAEALLNNPLDSVLILDLEGIVLNLNQSMANLLDKKFEEIKGKNVYDFIPVTLIASVKSKANEAIKKKKILRFEDEFNNTWYDHSIYPIVVDKKVIKIVIFSRNITPRKLAEIEKSEANRILDQIFHSSPSGMCIIDKELKISRVNESFLEFFKLQQTPVKGNIITNIIGEGTSEKHKMKMKTILNGSVFVEYEAKINVQDTELDFLITAVPFYSKDGEIIGCICNFQNVTEERNLQKIIIQIIQNERHRIGQELHDGLGQNLTAIAFLVELLHQKMKDREDYEIEEVVKIENLMKNAIRQTRSISRMLYPVEMEKNGLNAAIENLIESIEKVYDVYLKLLQDRNFLIDDHNVANHLFYIVREAINSAIKHGNAKNITIQLKSKKSEYSLIVDDDGENFEDIIAKNREMSLRIMEYRSKMIGAEFFVEEKKEQGYLVRVLLKKF